MLLHRNMLGLESGNCCAVISSATAGHTAGGWADICLQESSRTRSILLLSAACARWAEGMQRHGSCQVLPAQAVVVARHICLQQLSCRPDCVSGVRAQVATSKIDEYARGMISGSGSTLFEELGLYYIGPVDGHNVDDLVAGKGPLGLRWPGGGLGADGPGVGGRWIFIG